MKKLTREWVRKAEADRVLALEGSRLDAPVHDGVCFHCQQCAEKYLKALLQELGLSIPRTHVLRDLLGLLLPHYPSLRQFQRGLKFLTRFAVDTRYPGQQATKRQATAALRWADKVRASVRPLLGIRNRPRRAK